MISLLARVALTLAVTLACSVMPRSASAEQAFEWNPDWPRFRPGEYLLSGVAGSAALVLYFGVKDAHEPRRSGGVLFDDPIREAFRLRKPGSRDAARFVSDMTALTTLTWTIAADSLFVPVARGKTDLAGQLLLMDMEAFAVSTLITTSIFKIVARARPSYADCRRSLEYDPLCESSPMGSFPSGHTNTSFTAAGLSCAHHLHLPIYGDRTADVLACAGNIVLAATTGSLRVLGDRHYATDVWVGAMIGFAVGYGMPTLLHYGKVRDDTPTPAAMQPLAPSFPLGPSISGVF